MSFVSFFTTLFFLVLVLVVNAFPPALVAKSAFDVFIPRIISPDSSTVWTVGQVACVSWDTTNAPESISNGASIELYKYGTIAKDFDLREGSVCFVLPESVAPGPIFITLFGDSGNYSPVFTIAQK